MRCPFSRRDYFLSFAVIFLDDGDFIFLVVSSLVLRMSNSKICLMLDLE